jgi:hypothetical protein
MDSSVSSEEVNIPQKNEQKNLLCSKENLVIAIKKVEPEVSLTKNEIRVTTRENIKSIQLCYNELIKRKKASGGEIELELKLGSKETMKNGAIMSGRPYGVVEDAKINVNGLNDHVVAKCIVDTTKQWRFLVPRGQTPVLVTLLLIFGDICDKKSVYVPKAETPM